MGLKLELIGLVLIFFASGFQLFLVNEFVDMTNEAGLLQLETKIDYIWFTLADLYSHSDANTSGAISVSNFPAHLESWKS